MTRFLQRTGAGTPASPRDQRGPISWRYASALAKSTSAEPTHAFAGTSWNGRNHDRARSTPNIRRWSPGSWARPPTPGQRRPANQRGWRLISELRGDAQHEDVLGEG